MEGGARRRVRGVVLVVEEGMAKSGVLSRVTEGAMVGDMVMMMVSRRCEW